MSSPAMARHRTVDRPPGGSALRTAAQAPPAQPTPSPSPRAAGRFRLDPGSGAWWWSPEMFDLHGLPPGSATPDTEAYLRYQHAADRERVLAALSTACSSGRPFVLETRIVRGEGGERVVVLLGEPQLDAAGSVTFLDGMCIDLTGGRSPGSDGERAEALAAEVEQLRAAMASRAPIEQAKGILMLLTNCSGQVAFDLLAHISSHTHRKVRDVAAVITESAAGHAPLPDDVRAIIRDACPPAPPTG
jgi:hypothetical protein